MTKTLKIEGMSCMHCAETISLRWASAFARRRIGEI